MGWQSREPCLIPRRGQILFISAKIFIPVHGPIQPPCLMIIRGYFLYVKLLGHDVDFSLPSSTKVNYNQNS
jgi:hypothetical protein